VVLVMEGTRSIEYMGGIILSVRRAHARACVCVCESVCVWVWVWVCMPVVVCILFFGYGRLCE
jgi:hypothetical protein